MDLKNDIFENSTFFKHSHDIQITNEEMLSYIEAGKSILANKIMKSIENFGTRAFIKIDMTDIKYTSLEFDVIIKMLNAKKYKVHYTKDNDLNQLCIEKTAKLDS
jgi:hypothetical protein